MKRVATAVGLIGIFVVVMLAASVQGIPVITPPDFLSADGAVFDEPQPSGSPAASPPPEQDFDLATTIIGTIFLIVVIATVALIAILLVRALMRYWRERPLRSRAGGDVDFESTAQEAAQEADAVAPAIRRGIDGALRSIDAESTATDAIIAAWVGLEESAADAGIARGMSETPSEFALRIITRRAGITEAAGDLLGLYERVRFGDYVAGVHDRSAARTALQTIEEGWR
ncbi:MULTISPECIES: DUF4129 domain-containing protein [unclassified Microbacterium]|uniref:DUF4129 domain-containing protein n=1 Tax=unclassified Microbacterium TaxID=2609290 RepID=UPI002CC90A65|nr:DUF4129 domain-containing protein [Microbacterium sp.]HWK78074.1 DUF4129 domain-containing protein [Microbacterium sp.]